MTRLIEESDALHRRVRAFARGASPESFDTLALDIARFQARHSPGFARLVQLAGQPLERVERIPALPTEAFRLSRVAVHPEALDRARFVTSGTTGQERGVHVFRNTETYAELCVDFGRRALLARGRRPTLIALADAPTPSSSLAFMLERFAEQFDGRSLAGGPFQSAEPARYLLGERGVDRSKLEYAIDVARQRAEPLLVLATSFALVALLDAYGGARVALPEGSAVMQTGGFKGRSRELEPKRLRASIADSFGIPESAIISEYGMTELSSQLYEGTLPGAELVGPEGTLLEPPWLRVTPVDPVSLEPVPDGHAGLARFVDLANIDSAIAILTRDLVRRNQHGIELLGRAAGAPPRGCSLAVEALLEAGRAP